MTHGSGSRLFYVYKKAPPRRWCTETSENSKSAPLKQHTFSEKCRNLRFFRFFWSKNWIIGALLMKNGYLSSRMLQMVFLCWQKSAPVFCTVSIWFNLVKAPLEQNLFASRKSSFFDIKCCLSWLLWTKKYNWGAFTEEVLAGRFFLRNTFSAHLEKRPRPI